MKVAIIDDEAPARAKVRRLLAAHADFEVVGEAEDGEAALALIRGAQPELVLLDVHMPKLDGLGVVEAIGPEQMPLVIFLTAYDQHAIKAFELHAVDYLLKPFAAPRFARALARARERMHGQEQGHGAEVPNAQQLQALLTQLSPSPSYLSRLEVERGPQRAILLPVAEILIIRAQRNYTEFHTNHGEYIRRGSLKNLVERLDPSHFVQVNRSEVVGLDHVAEIQPWTHGDYRVLMTNGERLHWTRRYRAQRKGDFG